MRRLHRTADWAVTGVLARCGMVRWVTAAGLIRRTGWGWWWSVLEPGSVPGRAVWSAAPG